jgi:hypothetical protein
VSWRNAVSRYDLTRKLPGGQHFETHFVSKIRNEAQLAWIENNDKNMSNAFSLVQREIYTKEELSALTKLQAQDITQDEKERIKRWQEELETFDERYWLYMRAYYKGPLIRYWDLYHNNYFFYSKENELECKANGGCCESDCGCCRGSLKTTRSDFPMPVGHCTMECGCCIRRRGFYEPSDQKDNQMEIMIRFCEV